MITITFSGFTVLYVYFSIILLYNERVLRSPIALAYALALHYAISLLAITLIATDKISFFDFDLGGELL